MARAPLLHEVLKPPQCSNKRIGLKQNHSSSGTGSHDKHHHQELKKKKKKKKLSCGFYPSLNDPAH